MNNNYLEWYAGKDLPLSVRSFNLLKRAGINRIDELLEKTQMDIIKIGKNANDILTLFTDITVLFYAIEKNKESQ